jgi:carbon storage regulator
MLVLSRKSGQRIVIGDEIVVSIVEVRGNTVRLGIEAPRSVPVYREEVITRVLVPGMSPALVEAAG